MKKANGFLSKLTRKNIVWFLRLSCAILLAFMLFALVFQEKSWLLALIFSLALYGSFIINGYLDNIKIAKTVLYTFEFCLLLAYSLLYNNFYLSTIYSLILVDFYLTNSLKSNIFYGICCYIGYVTAIVLSTYFTTPNFNVPALATKLLSDLIYFVLVFCITNMLSAIINKNKEISKNLSDLAEREKKLQEAYNTLKEITKLEERNRIAKQIHDTTGHSITTIIMQTEAAKCIIDTDKEGAKQKIISANLQAITALEELRKSVHLLSGDNTKFNLSNALEKLISETNADSDVSIRAKYPENVDIDEDIAFFIYSSFKEGLSNGLRHGKSTAFFFELKITDNTVKFLLSDNGTGANTLSLGYGLNSMKKTAESFGGTIDFSTDSGEGFEIKMTLPTKKD